MSAKPDSIRSILYAFFANLCIAIARGLADSFNQLLLLSGMIKAFNRVGREFRQSFPVTKWLFFEPDDTNENI